jgi:hypothetical protein
VCSFGSDSTSWLWQIAWTWEPIAPRAAFNKPPFASSAALREVGPHGLHDEDVGQPTHDGLEARLVGRHLRRDELQVRLEPNQRLIAGMISCGTIWSRKRPQMPPWP